ncbi:unnamed protein product [Enterobius vermicularis]|uniref:C2H2-type domain-containing protein n=1 Tax=Enterobius vermicularis TaxID=51028 RepID=A0A0N4VJ32_ENTVE|nr:unnamed protein product [Enterobius vermicularis]
MADVTVSTNIFECSLCPQVLFSTPEELCHHMRQYHDMRDMVIQSVFFSDKTTFQHWLKTVEDGREQAGGYVQGNSNPFIATVNFQDEYYLLCKKKYCTLKRRRLSGEQKQENSVQHVVCAAFVHVTESSNGSVWVRYCLEHCGHPNKSRLGVGSENSASTKQGSSHLKRNSSSTRADSEDEDYASEEAMEESAVPAKDLTKSEPVVCNKVQLSEEAKAKISTHRKALLSSVEIELASAKASVSSIKDAVNDEPTADVYAKLQFMASQLRTVTQVLSDLAVDVSPSSSCIPMDI